MFGACGFSNPRRTPYNERIKSAERERNTSRLFTSRRCSSTYPSYMYGCAMNLSFALYQSQKLRFCSGTGHEPNMAKRMVHGGVLATISELFAEKVLRLICNLSVRLSFCPNYFSAHLIYLYRLGGSRISLFVFNAGESRSVMKYLIMRRACRRSHISRFTTRPAWAQASFGGRLGQRPSC